MSERRCPAESVYGHHQQCQYCEPQEGAGVAATDSATASVNQSETGPAPSCDSELAAIRTFLNETYWSIDNSSVTTLVQHGRALLRMVDELTSQLQASRELFNEATKAGDDLRAKLADAARIHVEAEARRAYRVKELEAKLAEAEKTLQEVYEERLANGRRAGEWQVRAEAAEARVRELEEALHAMGVYDPS